MLVEEWRLEGCCWKKEEMKSSKRKVQEVASLILVPMSLTSFRKEVNIGR